MEDLKPSSSPPPATCSDPAAFEERFTELCKTQDALPLDDYTTTQAIKLLNDSYHILLANMSAFGTGTPEEVERYWFAFILYTVKKFGQSNANEKGLSLCQILRATKLTIVDFFKELPQFILKVGTILASTYGLDWENRLEAKELQMNFVHLSLLSKHYKEAFFEFFHVVSADKASTIHSATAYVSDCYRFGWLLFMALRVHAFSRFKDLVTCTNGLITVLAILIIHVPSRYRKFTIHDSQRFVRKSDKSLDLVASLCNIYNTSEDELRKTMDKANELIANILKKIPCAASDCRIANLETINPDGLVYFEDLMDESSLSSSISSLEKDYDDALHNKGELDERIFVDEEDSLLASGSLSGGFMHLNGAKRKLDCLASPTKTITGPLSPLHSPSTCQASNNFGSANSKMAPTPVCTAMTTAKWLRTIISPVPSGPSPALERFLSSCDRDVSADVMRRAHIILEAIFPSNTLQSANLMDNIWAGQRRIEAQKLYYRVLESMCRAEAQILHAHNLTSLLTNERFHRCMLACSAELVLATHKAVTMLFPAVLERTGITAFDLSKVIESFIRYEESLPRELRRHLNSLEERLLESMVWEKGSSMYNSLVVAKPALASEINRLGLLAEPMASLDAIAVHMNISCGGLPPVPSLQNHDVSPGQNGEYRSPKRVCSDYRSVLIERGSFTSTVKDRLLANNLKTKLPPLQSAFASPTRPNPGGGGETCAETGISVFFSKIVKLAAVRINGMAERLLLSQQIRESVYCLVQQILSQRTILFFNRHIDQIILCCFYGIAKISQINLTFKEIIYNYRKQPHCKTQVFRNVFVDWSSVRCNGQIGKEHVDIITFYNEIFIPAAKPLLVELSPTATNLKLNRVPEVHNNNDVGQCPESPKMSPFPSLPDMSPKKVSATHNVYVSPLRSSKMDALISHSSKSYYACVGESTHAYQSPSKDLTAINKQLNGSRKLRGILNFDDDIGLVSDSLVANSLCIQNGSSTCASGGPMKSEKPDQ